jgi:hypothetical protein
MKNSSLPVGTPRRQPLNGPQAAPHIGTDEARRRLQRADQAAARPGATSPAPAELRFTTPDGALSFRVQPVDGVLYMERICRRPLGTMLVQAVVFNNAEEFRRWSDAEPLRFLFPVLHQRLCRFARECFDAAR